MKAPDFLAHPLSFDTLAKVGISSMVTIAVIAIAIWDRNFGPIGRFLHGRLDSGKATNVERFVLSLNEGTFLPASIAGALYFGFTAFDLTPAARHRLDLAGQAIVAWVIAKMVIAFISLLIEEQIVRNEKRGLTVVNLRAFLPFVQVIAWSLAFVFVLDDWGFHVSAIVGTLGIGGAAVALAAQSLLKDWFGYLALVSDKPFEIGHVVQVSPEYVGAVVSIGVRSTKFRSISGEEMTIPNSDLAATRLRNYSRMRERRVVFHFTVASSTPSPLLRRIPGVVRESIEKQTLVRFERSSWSAFVVGGYDFENVYTVLTGDDDVHMDRQHEINLELLSALGELGVALADPTLTVMDARKNGEAPTVATPRPSTQSERNRETTIP